MILLLFFGLLLPVSLVVVLVSLMRFEKKLNKERGIKNGKVHNQN
jgi:hypothetical protein